MAYTRKELGRKARELNEVNIKAAKDLKAVLYGLDDALMVLNEAVGERDIVKAKRIMRRAIALLTLNGTDGLKALDGMIERMQEIESYAAEYNKRDSYNKEAS